MHFLIKGKKEDSTEKCMVPGLGQKRTTVSLEYFIMGENKDVKENIESCLREHRCQPAWVSIHQEFG